LRGHRQPLTRARHFRAYLAAILPSRGTAPAGIKALAQGHSAHLQALVLADWMTWCRS
jgi:hypothetical protein